MGLEKHRWARWSYACGIASLDSPRFTFNLYRRRASSYSAYRVAGFSVLAILLSGCIILPIPSATTAPRYSPAKLESVRENEATQRDTEIELGVPDFRLEAGRVWIYGWTVYRGKWVMGVFMPYAIGGDVGGHVTSRAFLLVLEFDGDGMLRTKEFAHEVPGGRDRFCTGRDLCIEHPVYDMIEIDGKLDTTEPHEAYRSGYIAVTVKGKAREGAGKLEPQPAECLLFIWPTQEWAHKGDWYQLFGSAPNGLALTIEGAPQWQQHAWLPAETFAVISLPAGAHVVHALYPPYDEDVIHHPWGQLEDHMSSSSFECKPGESTYLAIGRSEKEVNAIVLRPTDAATAKVSIADMPQVLLP